MKRSLTMAGLLATAVVPSAFAEAYQLELTGTYEQTDQDNIDTDSYRLSGVAHFKRVNTDGHPLEEAAYLERSNFVEASYQHDDTDDGTDTDNKDNTFAFALHLNTGERYFVDLGYNNGNLENGDHFDAELGFGAYIQDNITTFVNLTDSTTDNDDGSGFDTQSYEIGGRGVFALGDEQAVSVQANFEVNDSDNGMDNTEVFGLSGRYYIMRTTHVGLGYEMSSSDDEDTDGFTLEAQHFITPQIAVGASFGQQSSDDDNVEDEDSYSLWAKLRF